MSLSRISLPRISLLNTRLHDVGEWLSPLGLRLLLAWEFYESGMEKLGGENWFADIAQRFPPPFSVLSPTLNWTLATWLELAGSLALLLGLATRASALVLWVLTVVAIAAVHWPEHWSSLAELWQGYAITDHGFGNYKLPLLYLAMLLPLIFSGGGRFSLDHLLVHSSLKPIRAGVLGWGTSLLALCLPLTALFPAFGVAGALLGAVLVAIHLYSHRITLHNSHERIGN
jgi:putative oxidoreductase